MSHSISIDISDISSIEDKIEFCRMVLTGIRKDRKFNILYFEVFDKKDVRTYFEKYSFNFADENKEQDIVILDGNEKDDILCNELIKCYEEYHKHLKCKDINKHQLSNIFFLSEIRRRVEINIMNRFEIFLKIDFDDEKLKRFHLSPLDRDKIPKYNMTDILVRLHGFKENDLIYIKREFDQFYLRIVKLSLS